MVEFKAGRMNASKPKDAPADSEQLELSADKRKGLVQLSQVRFNTFISSFPAFVLTVQTPDNLIHFIWKDRTTGVTEDVFPFLSLIRRI